MKLSETLIESIANGNITQLYKHFRLLKSDGTIKVKEYDKVRFGINFMFDIHDYFDELYNLKRKSGIMIIGDKEIKLEDFRSEIEEREDFMRKIVYENMEIIESTESRVLFE